MNFTELGDDFVDFLQRIQKSGRLILVTSSLTVGKKVFGSQSPMLGFFVEFKLEIIKLSDVLRSLKIDNSIRALELAILMRGPITIPFKTNDSIESYTKSIQFSFKTIPALLGEVFTESVLTETQRKQINYLKFRNPFPAS